MLKPLGYLTEYCLNCTWKILQPENNRKMLTTSFNQVFLGISAYCIIIFSSSVQAVQPNVLDINEIISADITTLSEDTKIFNTIGMGIALSIAECDGRDICDPTVDEDEIGKLIETLDRRIEDVISREQNDEEELTTIRTAYIDTRDKYADYMERLSKITKPELPEEELIEEDFFVEEDAMTEDEYGAFDDTEDVLEDDEDLGDDDYDPEDT